MQGQLSREMEFDFVEGSSGGTFVATNKIRAVILAHLNKGEIDQAASLIATSAPDMADRLLEEDGKYASQTVREALAEAFVRARDFERAGRAALLIGDPGRAAPFFERSYKFSKAAELYQAAGKFDRVAELYERDLRYDLAGRFYEQAGQPERAAAAYEKASRGFDAGRIWMNARRLDRAVESLQKVDRTQEHFAPAMLLLGRILTHAGHKQAAASHYIEVVKSRPLDATTVEIYERLAEIYASFGEIQAARKLYHAALKFDPSRQKAAQGLEALGDSPAKKPAATSESKTSAPPKLALPGNQDSPTQDSGAALKPLALPPPPGGQTSDPGADTFTAVNHEVDVLRKLPLFADLALDELRALQAFGARQKFPAGATLIEQGRDGTDLFVVLSGQVTVLHVDADQCATVLGELGQGASLGEMALVDEGPTSARVVASSEVCAFRWPMDKLRRHLATNEGTAYRLLRVISRTLSVRLRETNRRAAGEK